MATGQKFGVLLTDLPPQKKPRTWIRINILFSVFILIFLWVFTSPVFPYFLLDFSPWSWSTLSPTLSPSTLPKANNTDNPTFNWAEITPSRSLQWHPCYSTQHDCARLDVPMDWQDPSDDKRVVLAIIRLRASNLSDYRGPVFFNPGGPGGSGIWSMLDHGEDLQTIIGQNHDLVTFDPRGVGNSVPRIECWKHAQDRALWELQDIGVLDAYPGLIYDAYARAQVISRVCESNEDLAGKDGILAHSSTVYHARDMLEILEQMGETGLKYWGFSYGTVLGGIFAALWPQKVERMVNDGNVDYQEWYTGAYLNFLRDTDKVMSSFYHFCHLAGPLRCAFYSETPSLIETRLTSLLEKIRLSPIPIEYNISPSTPQLITYTSLKLMLSTSLYQPVLRFPPVAEVLAALEARNATPYYLYTTSDNPSLPNNNPLCFPETVVPPSTPLSIPQEATPDAFAAIMCSDALLDTLSPQEFEEYHQTLQNISHISGSVQVNFRLSCVGREIRPKWRKPKTLFDEKKKTRFPILFVNNIGDNVTPLVSARRNSELFEKSVVLVQEGYGHTSLAAGSRCMAEKVRGYFQEGKVTGEGRCGGMLPFGVEEGEGGGEDELGMVVGRLVGRWRGVF